MTDLWLFNKHKFRYAAIWICIAWSAICIPLFIWLSTLKGFPGITLSVTVASAALLLTLPTILISIIYADLHYRSKLAQPLFADPALSQLDSIGFAKIYQHQDSKWLFIKAIWQGQINGFTIKIFTTKKVAGKVLFKAYVKHQHIDKDRFHDLSAVLAQKNISFDMASLIKTTPVKQISQADLTAVKKDLFDFTETLRRLNFEPQ